MVSSGVRRGISIMPRALAIAEALLRESPNLKILTTSREPLNVDGEAVWQVPTLSVPLDLPTR